MVCTLCGLEITNPDAGCEWCKGHDAATNSRPLADPRLVTAKLAEANLARMRGHWEEAEACCIDVLRLDPSNLEAHSLLGDLYRDQDRLDDAAQWYRLALDINSNSTVDQAKLKSVEREMERRSHQPTEVTERRPVTNPIGTHRLLGASPITWVRALTVISVVFVLAVGGVLFAMQSRRHVPPKPPAANATTIPYTPPSATPKTTPPPTQDGALNLTDRPDNPRATPKSAMTSQELMLAQQVERAGLLSVGTSLIDITVSPSSLRVDVALVRTEEAAATAENTREAVLHDASRVARVLLASEPRISRVSVSMRTRTADGHVQPTFEGATDRQSMNGVPESATPETEAAAFPGPWWDPAIAPQASGKAGHPDDNNM
jgi:hypothetical protein